MSSIGDPGNRETLTASLEDTPDTQGGEKVNTFESRFNEGSGTSFQPLRDDAFSVANGTVVKDRWLTQGSNLRWEMHVDSACNADVTVVLPVTTRCGAQGGHLHQGRQETVQLPGLHRLRTDPIGPGDRAGSDSTFPRLYPNARLGPAASTTRSGQAHPTPCSSRSSAPARIWKDINSSS